MPSHHVALVAVSDQVLSTVHSIVDREGRRPMGYARYLDIEEHEFGAYLFRYDSAEKFAGDTWHESVADAKDQAGYEYGVDSWFTVPPGEPCPLLYLKRIAG